MMVSAIYGSPAVVDSNQLPWVDSPVSGVQRRMLERDGGEVARATSIVKLRQFDAEDTNFVRIDTHTADWLEENGEATLPLHAFGSEKVALQKWLPGSTSSLRVYPQGAEILLLEGTLSDENGSYGPGTWLRLPAASQHTPYSEGGCSIYIKTGHLQKLDTVVSKLLPT